MKSFPAKVLILLAAAASPAALVPPAHGQDVRISSVIPCADWTAARKKKAAVNYEHYVQGFFDGYSLAAKIDFWGTTEATRLTPAEAFSRMDKFCEANALSNTLEGAHRMLAERHQQLTAAQKKPEEKKKR